MSTPSDESPDRSLHTSRIQARNLLSRIGLTSETAAVFDELMGEAQSSESPADDLAELLRVRWHALGQSHDFKPGDLVTWKHGMQNRRFPKERGPAVVVQVLHEPLLDSEKEVGNPYFREPLDVVLGVLVQEAGAPATFLTYYFDSRRFMPYRAT